MGSSDAPEKSVKDLLSDRSLEQKLQFDAGEAAAMKSTSDDDLPDLMTMAAQRAAAAPAGGPRQARRAVEARKDDTTSSSTEKIDDATDALAKLIPWIKNEKTGELMPSKLLEVGAWLGIGLLILWEIYINSPLFERVAPMAPVVY